MDELIENVIAICRLDSNDERCRIAIEKAVRDYEIEKYGATVHEIFTEVLVL